MKSGRYTQNIGGYAFTVRFDVDGNYPQNKISIDMGSTYAAHWIADLSSSGNNEWEGNIWYRKDGAESLGVTSEGKINSSGSLPDRIHVYYGGYYSAGGFYYIYVTLKKSGTNKYWKYWYKKESDYFREVNVEIDHESGINPITSLNPHDVDSHRPASLPNETITVTSTFQKAGINVVRNTSNENAVATSGAGSNSKWSNAELHDAMQTQWSKSEAAAWAMWVFQANKHEDSHSGIMFDDIGAHHRCGTAIFHGLSTYSSASAGVANRHKFHTLIHEMGHTFNLYHSWIKTSGTSNWHSNVANESEARSYMNYPNRVAAGYYGFFDNFEYRFSDQELLFMRHAPEAFVKMGGSTFGTDHAGDRFGEVEAYGNDEPSTKGLALSVGSNKAKASYEFLELVNLDLKLTNTGNEAQEVAKDLLDDVGHMGIKVSRNGELAKEYKPYATLCHGDEEKVSLAKDESIDGEICLAGGKLGWVVDAPGIYEIIVCVHIHNENGEQCVTAAPFTFVVEASTKEEEKIAGDYFTDDVGRTLAMGGTKVLTDANNVLNKVIEVCKGKKAGQQAELTVNLPNTRKYKTITVNADGSKTITEDSTDGSASESIKKILVQEISTAKENLGAKTFEKLCKKVADNLKEQGDTSGAATVEAAAQ